jgi:crotonobetainyl-CoA:carnitine CoA-transferase CaiB-like acyl-CoA transferase
MAETRETGPLSHLRVVDMAEGRAGPYMTKLLAGFGAEVVKIEPPGIGDAMRSVGPFVSDGPLIERSIPFLWLNTGKKSVALDLTEKASGAPLDELLGTSDLVVETLEPSKADALGLSPRQLLARHPHLVVVSITNFGLSGPYRDFEAEEIVEYAMSGLMHLTGDPQRAPLAATPAITDYTAGMNAYIAALVALHQRRATTRGQIVEVSIQESALDNIEVAMAEYLHQGKVAKRTGDEHALVPWQLFPCRDGYAAVIGGPIRHWLTAVDLFEEPNLEHERYAHMRSRIEHRDEVKRLIQPWLDAHDGEDVFHAGQQRGLAFGYLAGLDEVVASPQHAARGFFVEIDHPIVGPLLYCGAPFRLAGVGWTDDRAPALGEHDEMLRTPLGGRRRATDSAGPRTPEDLSARSVQTTRSGPGESGRPPLEGVRIIDLTHDWAGPHATRVLADFGAEVIKVEYVRRLDGMRGANLENRAYDRHPRWLEINRNKLSTTLDLKTAKGFRAFLDLTRQSDVVIESSRVGVLERLGLGCDVLHSVRPELIVVRMSPFGQTGPFAGYAGYGGCLEPLSGVQELTGYEETSPPRRIREVDVTNGILGACAVMTALVNRQRTGRGDVVDLSELETATAGLLGEQLLEFVASGELPRRHGNRHARFAPHGCYRCAGEDQWVAIVIRNVSEWGSLCALIGRPELADGELAATAGRHRAHDELDQIIEAWTTKRSHYEAMCELQAHGIPAGAVLTVADLAKDPHLSARGFIRQAEDGSPGAYPGLPFRLSEGVGGVWRRGPALGEHNHDVLGGLLGWSDDEIDPVDESQIGTAFDPLPIAPVRAGTVDDPSRVAF